MSERLIDRISTQLFEEDTTIADDPVFVGEISSWFNHPSGEIWVVVRRPFESVPAPLNRLTRME
jgi:hypothetical protein